MRFRYPLLAAALLLAFPAQAQTFTDVDLDRVPGLTAKSGGDLLGQGLMTGGKMVPGNASTLLGSVQSLLSDGFLTVFPSVVGVNTVVTSASLYLGAPGTNGTLLATDTEFTQSDGEWYFDGIGLALDAAQQAQLAAGNMYVSVATAAFPNGEVRAQLEPSVSLGTFRAQGAGASGAFNAVVLRAKGAFAYVYDGSVGIAIRQASGPWFDAVANGTIRTGTTVRIDGTASEFNGLLQINGSDLASFEIGFETWFNHNRGAGVADLADLSGPVEAAESRIIAVQNAVIGGTGTFQAATTYSLTDANGAVSDFTLRIPNAADSDVDGLPIPTGPVTFVGVVSQFTTGAPDVGYQFVLVDANDLEPTTQIQVIHNSADPALATVDLTLDGVLAFDDMGYQDATASVTVPAYDNIVISLETPAGQTVSLTTDAMVLAPDVTGRPLRYVLNGVLDPAQFPPNPDGRAIDAALSRMFNSARRGRAGVVGTSFVNGVTDAPSVRLELSGEVLTENTQYPLNFDTFTRRPLAPQVQTLDVVTASGTVLGSFPVDLSAYATETVTLLASGFLVPALNRASEPFSLLLIAEDGTSSVIVGDEARAASGTLALSVAPNPSRGAATVTLDLPTAGDATVTLFDALGRRVAVLADGAQPPGVLSVALPAVAPGVYVVRAVTPSAAVTRTVSVVR